MNNKPYKPSARNSRNSYKKRRPSFGGNSFRSKKNYQNSDKIPHHKYIQKIDLEEKSVVYEASNTFASLNLHPQLFRNVLSRGYETLTKIQDQAIPHILQNKDILGIGKTGSGKTGAFLIPMINKSLKDQNERVLIISPTRELASQIHREFTKFTSQTRSRMTLVIGGDSIGKQISHLRNKPQFVVATPGRLLDLFQRGKIDLRTFNNIILDEVDQMLDMGFLNDIEKIISELGAKRQSLFFSATMSPREEAIANRILRDPIKVVADVQKPHANVDQDIVKVTSQSHKIKVLEELVQSASVTKAIVFSRTKRGADRISQELNKKGLLSDSLHGGKRQNVRKRVLDNFHQNRINILVATDVAARGIDIPNVSHVINYDEPDNYKDYIHRIGRTGRIGNKGIALTFVLS